MSSRLYSKREKDRAAKKNKQRQPRVRPKNKVKQIQ